jgi:M6 family metalloprotease-like protein
MSRHVLLTLVLVAGSFGLAACRDDWSPTEPESTEKDSSPQLSQGSSGSISGWLHSLRGDPKGGRGVPVLRHHLIDDQGRATELVLDEELAARLGGHRAMHRRRVRVDGEVVAPRRMQVHALELEQTAEPAGGVHAAAVKTGSYPYVTIGCKFADLTAEPHTIATYAAWTTGSSYPGLNHYWRELSYNQMDVAGSTMVGWYTLPHPQSHYVTANGLDFQALVTDCTGAADPDVNFPQYYGVNMQFNASLGCCSWGGTWPVTADGQTRNYGMTWMADWADLGVYAHEEGHSLGLPHSSGPYSETYDSRWDMMSGGSGFFDPAQSTAIPQHTIGYHKDLLGWIPAARKLIVGANSSQTITLERLAQPGSGNYLVAQIPIDNAPGQFYTVEARRLAGSYDAHLPGEAVVLHRVDPTRGDRLAQVVDPDSNGDPNDAGAQWTVGETFTDEANGITVRVNAQTATGFQVAITRGVSGAWVSRASLTGARSAFALGTAGTRLYAVGGQRNGSALSSVEAYSAASNTWTAKAPLPGARYDGNGAAAISGVLYLPGGRNSSGTLTRTLYAYTISSNVWTAKAALPVASGCGATVNFSGSLYVLTGCDGTSGFKGRLHRYTPSTNSWTARASAPAAHGYPTVGVINGKLYVAGGRKAAGSATATLHVYDPAANAWTTKRAMPSARYGAAGRVINGKLYVVGGTDASGNALATAVVYDPATNGWSTEAPMPTARTGPGAGVIKNLLYAVGGRVGSTDLTSVERYTP